MTGHLTQNACDRWSIDYPNGRPEHELTSGSMIEIRTGKRWVRTRIEYDHAAKAYVSVDGHRLHVGLEARLP